MNNNPISDILHYLFSPQNTKSLIVVLATIALLVLVPKFALIDSFTKVTSYSEEINANKTKLETLKEKQKSMERKQKENQVKIENIPVAIYKPASAQMSTETAAIEFVTKVIGMLEQTGNSVIDISYKTDSTATGDKNTIPATISVIELTMTLNGTYAALQDFVYELYGYDYLATIKAVKSIPLKENKNILETDIVLWLYISK